MRKTNTKEKLVNSKITDVNNYQLCLFTFDIPQNIFNIKIIKFTTSHVHIFDFYFKSSDILREEFYYIIVIF